MKKFIRRDKKIRQFFFKYEFFFLYNRFLFRHSLAFPKKTQTFFFKKGLFFFFYNKKKALCLQHAIVRRCILTRRGRGVFRNFNLSRHVLREFLSFGFILGYKKFAW